MPHNESRLEVIGLEKTYGDFSVSLDLKVDEGETLVLAGPSGSGKTTALNLIAGLTTPDAGRVLIGGDDVGALPPWKRNISMVFQDLALFPHLDVGGNIAYGLFIRKVRRNERRKIIDEALELVRLPGYASRRVHTLSGGERQRVAIARALAVSPGALLLDEPFSSLDLPLRKELRQEFLEIRSRSKAPCIFVTHDREEAIMLGSRIALMNAGRVVECGAGCELFLSPKTEFAARFLGAGHVLPCEITGKEPGVAGYIPAVYMSPDYLPMAYVPIEYTLPEYTHYKVSTPLGTMTVPMPAETRQGSDGSSISTPPADAPVKLFIPHDAISLEDSAAPSGRAPSGHAPSGRALPGRKLFGALCRSSFFNGPNLIVKVSLQAPEHSAEQISMEIITGPRTKIPAPGGMVDISVDERLLRFVRGNSGQNRH
jgi:ABC-type Fe3+/spermidine/putrescine transport system ATPase subunit